MFAFDQCSQNGLCDVHKLDGMVSTVSVMSLENHGNISRAIKLKEAGYLREGMQIYVSLLNWYELDKRNSTEYGTEQQLFMHFIGGTISSVTRHSRTLKFTITFTAFDQKMTLTARQLADHPNTYFYRDHLPPGGFVMERAGDMDPWVCRSNPLPDVSDVNMDAVPAKICDFMAVSKEREAAMKDMYGSAISKLNDFSAAGVSIVDHQILISELPAIIKFSIRDRNIKNSSASDLEEERIRLLSNLSIRTRISDSLEMARSFWYLFVQQNNKLLGSERKRIHSKASWKIPMAYSFAEGVLVPWLKLTDACESAPPSELGQGHLFRLSVPLEGMKLAGITPSTSNGFINGFQRVAYYSETEALFGTHYQLIMAENHGTLPFIINPDELSNDELTSSPKVVAELGKCYPIARKLAPEIRFDLMQSRLASTCPKRHNFGIKWWAQVDSAHPFVFDILEMSDSLDICILEVEFVMRRESITVHRDAITGRVQVVVGDV